MRIESGEIEWTQQVGKAFVEKGHEPHEVVFAEAFAEAPSVVVGLRGMQASLGGGGGFKLRAERVRPDGFVVTVEQGISFTRIDGFWLAYGR